MDFETIVCSSLLRRLHAAEPAGVSSAGANAGDSSTVALCVDGVYQAAQATQLMDLPDVERMEVLKGPQGTSPASGSTRTWTTPR